MSNSNNCSQCAPAPCGCSAVVPPPSCTSVGCEEYIQSDCVVSTIDTQCTAVFESPSGDVNVGLVIEEGTTLTDVYGQLTTTACPTNPDVIGAVLQIIQNTPVLSEIFCNMVCACNCGDPCAIVEEVEQIIFTNITDDGFSLTFSAQVDYNYYIRINDMNTSPATYYVYDTSVNPTPALPNPGPLPTSVTLATSAFTKYVNNVPVPGAFTLASNTTFEVLATAILPDGSASCETGPFTVQTEPDPACVCTTTINVINSVEVPALPDQLSVDIIETGGTTPVAFQITVTNLTTSNIASGPVDIARDPSGTTTYTIALPADDYEVEVIPICSFVPRCTGTAETVNITVNAAPSCAPPDITSVTIVI